jgi:predicted RNA-binding Zn-ribbon protein involved in translation (DUF1610 family)
MKPLSKYITIGKNVELITQLIKELVLQPRLKALEWSKITHQTPNMKIGYPGQHLASLALGMKGKKTGARGNDIVDGSEVKSCSRVDASDTCNACKEKISRAETVCPNCASTDISRNNDSKWLFTIRSEADLKLLTKTVKRVVLVLADYPDFDKGDYNSIRFQIFEIWTNSIRCKAFKKIMTDYYKNVYLSHKKKDSAKTPAPQNFWPYSFQFYKSNPIKIFSCLVANANQKPNLIIEEYIKPSVNRSSLMSEKMPTELLKKDEFLTMIKKASEKSIKENLLKKNSYVEFRELLKKKNFKMKDVFTYMPLIDEQLREYLPIRKAKPFTITTKHVRR